MRVPHSHAPVTYCVIDDAQMTRRQQMRGHLDHCVAERASALKHLAGARRFGAFTQRCTVVGLALGRPHLACPGDCTCRTADARTHLQCSLWFSSISTALLKSRISLWSFRRATCAALSRARRQRGGSARVSAPALARVCVGGTPFCERERVNVRDGVGLCQ